MDVNPAAKSEPKNSTPIKVPESPMVEIIFGNATNARPGPPLATSCTGTLVAVAIKPNTEKIPTPAKISNDELAKPTTKPEPVKLAFRLR